MRKKQWPGSGSINYGVQHSGGPMNGVQNQVGNSGSQQSQVTTTPDTARTAADFAEQLTRVRAELAAVRSQVSEYEQCTGFLTVAAQQDVTEPESRGLARSMLEEISRRCGGARVVHAARFQHVPPGHTVLLTTR